jgi:2-polyprenyl-6-methoxyphenol hydroxylase-like FAD-dependent oxidoreductase
MKILIAGGGLGGLTAAIALLRIGFQVEIFEKSHELREIGAGLGVWPNATRVLRKLGPLEEALCRSQVINSIQVRTWRGELISEVRIVGQFDTPGICIHRADLLSILSEQVPSECVHLGEKLESFKEHDTGVAAGFSSGTTAEGDVLVGADGIHSRVRALLWGETKPVYRGYQAWRGIAAFEIKTRPPTISIEFWGHGKRFGMAPIGLDRVFWYATANALEGTLGGQSTWKQELLGAFQDWSSPIPELIEGTEREAILKHEIVDRPPLRRWGKGRITLLGDAAHLTTPNLGQGACLAIEDAAVLARCLAKDEDTPKMLRQYESLRHARAAFIVRESRWIGQLGQLENRLAVALRTLVLKLSPRILSEMRHRLYYSYEA